MLKNKHSNKGFPLFLFIASGIAFTVWAGWCIVALTLFPEKLESKVQFWNLFFSISALFILFIFACLISFIFVQRQQLNFFYQKQNQNENTQTDLLKIQEENAKTKKLINQFLEVHADNAKATTQVNALIGMLQVCKYDLENMRLESPYGYRQNPEYNPARLRLIEYNKRLEKVLKEKF
jgi:hypothetical protein